MTSAGTNIMWQVCLGQRLHAALAADHITTENVRICLAYATDYRPATMEQDWNYMHHHFERDDPGQSTNGQSKADEAERALVMG
jgi:hypothetical protein